MKKGNLFLVLIAVVLSFVATGCGASKESKLVCKQSKSGVDITFNIGFKGKIIKTMDFGYDMDLSKYSDTQVEAIGKQDFCKTVKAAMSSYKDAFTDCKQNIDNKHLKVSSVLDVDKIAKNVLDKMSTPEATKKELETQGYKCTLE